PRFAHPFARSVQDPRLPIVTAGGAEAGLLPPGSRRATGTAVSEAPLRPLCGQPQTPSAAARRALYSRLRRPQPPGRGLPAAERLDRVSRLIEGFETPYGMELLATVHWVAQEEPGAALDASTATAKVHEWSARKRQSFKPEHIRTAWQRLHEEEWLPAAQPL